MLIRVALTAALAALLIACGSEETTKPPTTIATKKAERPKPADESHRFPKANLTGTEVVDKALLGKNFMPGGTVVHYKNGKSEYDMFAGKLDSPEDAAILLLDWKKALTDAKLVPSFGGYFGQDGTRPVFVFPKGSWIAGVAGLPEKQADTQARLLAAELN